jgi:NAD(P)-dependent dehydrogenase (short-subunit alcohol dehydrogenase family)
MVRHQPVMVATGLTSGIGRALVARLGQQWTIVALGRTSPGDGVHWLPVDLRKSPTAWLSAVRERLVADYGHVEAFIHLAGVVYSDRTESTTLDEWESTVAVNLATAFHMGAMLSPLLSPGASVVLVGSVDARHASQDGPAAAYGAAKAGLFGLVRHWAAEWGERGIRVNGVAPGAILTGNGPADDKVRERLQSRISLGRLGYPEEVAAVIAFLLSPDASYVTGCWLSVDGGLNIRY